MLERDINPYQEGWCGKDKLCCPFDGDCEECHLYEELLNKEKEE